MPLQLAIPNKGRLCQETIDLLARIGWKVGDPGRRLAVPIAGESVRVLFARAQDIPEFVHTKACHLGVTGLDCVHEAGVDVRRLLDLPYGRCRLVVAAPEDAPFESADAIPAGSRVATTFPNLTRRYFEKKKIRVEIIPLSGAAELAPTIGVADLITDLVETGSTLRTNRLKLIDVIEDSQAAVIGGASLSDAYRERAEEFVGAMRSVVEALDRRYLMANAPEAALAAIRGVLPGLSAPTVMPLAGKPGWVAVHAVVRETDLNGVIPKLQSAGATGILVMPIERMVP